MRDLPMIPTDRKKSARTGVAGAEGYDVLEKASHITTQSDCGIGHRDPHAAGRAIGDALTIGADARDLAAVLVHRLDEADCIFINAASAWAVTPGTALRMAEAVQEDAIAATWIDPTRVGATGPLEAERQRQAWARHCADPTRRLRRANA